MERGVRVGCGVWGGRLDRNQNAKRSVTGRRLSCTSIKRKAAAQSLPALGARKTLLHQLLLHHLLLFFHHSLHSSPYPTPPLLSPPPAPFTSISSSSSSFSSRPPPLTPPSPSSCFSSSSSSCHAPGGRKKVEEQLSGDSHLTVFTRGGGLAGTHPSNTPAAR